MRRADAETPRRGLYTPQERQRRDTSPWTTVQGILAPVQFLVCLVSIVLIARYLATGEGYALATISIVVKTLTLYTIMVTGAIWEKEVFGVYLFAEPFFWEDVVSFGVIALHTFYLFALFTDLLGTRGEMLLALAAYAAYVVNAVQFVLKLRAARLQESSERESRARQAAAVSPARGGDVVGEAAR
ncbi:MAG: 2-vinyl bacteriochlorophyllide hydratase [Salinarimonas sp.]